MWVITGAAGFIGSVAVWKLNQENYADILVVDRHKKPDETGNLRKRRFSDYLEADDFQKRLLANQFSKIEGIVHMGACSSTTETDEDYLTKNNFEYTRDLASWALSKKVPFIYASSAATYGDGSFGYKTDDATTKKLVPLNLYGHSKQQFDLWALEKKVQRDLVGIKFFNIYGPNEYHKGDMRSVVAKSFEQIKASDRIQLFKSYKKEYHDGEQKRDFLYVKDAVNVMYDFMQKKLPGGLYNLGSGQARPWNALANAVFDGLGKPPRIEYIEMPESIRPRYQYHTQADMSWLKKFKAAPFMALEDGVRDYVQNYLSQKDPYL